VQRTLPRYSWLPGDDDWDYRMRTIIPLAALFALITVTAARADEWCSFIDKAHAPVHCGYSSLADCKQSIGDSKNGYCMPDPSFASRAVGARLKLASE